MQYEADTPQDYIASLTLDWRADRLKAIRQMILNIAPELTVDSVFPSLSKDDWIYLMRFAFLNAVLGFRR